MPNDRANERWWDTPEVLDEVEDKARRVGRLQALVAMRFLQPNLDASDARIADLLRNGDPPALDSLAARMAPTVHRLVYRPGDENPTPAVEAFRALMDVALEVGTAEGVRAIRRALQSRAATLPHRSGSFADALHARRGSAG